MEPTTHVTRVIRSTFGCFVAERANGSLVADGSDEGASSLPLDMTSLGTSELLYRIERKGAGAHCVRDLDKIPMREELGNAQRLRKDRDDRLGCASESGEACGSRSGWHIHRPIVVKTAFADQQRRALLPRQFGCSEPEQRRVEQRLPPHIQAVKLAHATHATLRSIPAPGLASAS